MQLPVSLILFDIAALGAIGLLCNHARRRYGAAHAAGLFALLAGYFLGLALVSSWIHHLRGRTFPFAPASGMLTVGDVSAFVIVGWVFPAYLSFQVARAVRDRLLPRTNVLMVLAIASLLIIAIAYCVEVTGTRMGFWTWNPLIRPFEAFPFAFPRNALMGWTNHALAPLLIWCAWRERLFTPRRFLNVALVLAFFALKVPVSRLSPWHAPHFVFILALFVLGWSRSPVWAGHGIVDTPSLTADPAAPARRRP